MAVPLTAASDQLAFPGTAATSWTSMATLMPPEISVCESGYAYVLAAEAAFKPRDWTAAVMASPLRMTPAPAVVDKAGRKEMRVRQTERERERERERKRETRHYSLDPDTVITRKEEHGSHQPSPLQSPRQRTLRASDEAGDQRGCQDSGDVPCHTAVVLRVFESPAPARGSPTTSFSLPFSAPPTTHTHRKREIHS